MIYLDVYQELIGFSGIDPTHDHSRTWSGNLIRGARVNNGYVQVTFEGNVYFDTVLIPVGRLAQTVLDTPSMLHTDIVWDASLGGTVGGGIGIGGPGLGLPTLGDYVIWIVIGVIAIVAVYIVIKRFSGGKQRIVVQIQQPVQQPTVTK
jgi:hypothetical protein